MSAGEIADVDISLSKDITDMDDVSTSLLSSQLYSRKEDVVHLRKYRIRKLRKLVDKCRIKNIRFPMYYVRISTNLAKNVDAVTDVELLDLTTECLQSLGSDFTQKLSHRLVILPMNTGLFQRKLRKEKAPS